MSSFIITNLDPKNSTPTGPVEADRQVPNDTSKSEQTEELDALMSRMTISDEPRSKLRSWLGNILKVSITDKRVIVGCFVCTDREGNTILESSWEYTHPINGKLRVVYINFNVYFETNLKIIFGKLIGNNEPKNLGLALIPGKHIVSIQLMTH